MRNKSTFLALVILGLLILPGLGYLSSITEERIIELTNKERINYNLPALMPNDQLAHAAKAKGQFILEQQKFQHNFDDKKFSSWIKEAGYEYQYAGENLAIDFYTSEGAVKAWMESPTHKENIVSEKFQEIGIAVVEGEFEGHKSIVIVQIFGTKLNPPAISKDNDEKTLAGTTVNNLSVAGAGALSDRADEGGFFHDLSFQTLAIAMPLIVLFLLLKSIKTGENIRNNRFAAKPIKATKHI